MKMNLEGHLITLEGGDGAGKSSVLHFLYQKLLDKKIPVIKTREPGGTPFGDEVRKLLLHCRHGMRFGARAELLLFLASRAQNVEEVIIPALREGKIVLCDRFNDSSVAYQGFARNFGLPEVQEICSFATSGVQPLLTLFLDVYPNQGLERVRKSRKTDSAGLDRIESESALFHEEVRRAYLLLAEKEPERIVTIDANQPLEAVCDQALEIVLDALHKTASLTPNDI